MADKKTNVSDKKTKGVEKKPNFFVRVWNRIKKFFKDTTGEMRKVTWMSKKDLFKSSKIVLVTVVAVALAIAIVDTIFSYGINGLAGLFG